MIQAFKKNYQVNNPNLKIFLIAGSADPVIQSKEKFNELKQFLSKIGYSNIKSKLQLIGLDLVKKEDLVKEDASYEEIDSSKLFVLKK